MSWASTDQARAHWPDSASLQETTLQTLLEVATTQCEAYAPTLVALRNASLTNGSATVVATGGSVFTLADVGAAVVGEGVAPDSTIVSVAVGGTSAELSFAATEDITSSLLSIERTVPNNYMLGTVYQAREVYAAGQRDGDIIGIGDYAIRARPLTSTVKSLLRPQSQPPKVG